MLALVVAPFPAHAGDAAMVRLAQLTPDLQGVELVVSSVANPDDNVLVAALGYGELSPYRALPPGDYVIAVRPAGSTAPPTVSRTIAVRSGASYTVAAVGADPQNGLTVFDDDLTPPPDPAQTRMRVINAAPPAPALDVRGTAGEALALGVPVGRASAYTAVPAGDATLAVGAPGAAAVPLPVALAPNQVVSVVLTSAGGGLQARVVVDAAGPAVVPPGPVHAGFGGAADDPASRGVGSAVLVVLAAGAALVSVRLARRGG